MSAWNCIWSWETDPPRRPLVMSLWIKPRFSQTRPDSDFALFKHSQQTRHKGSGGAMPATWRREWNAVTANERQPLCRDVWSKRAFKDPLLPLWRCPQAKHPAQQRVKTSNRFGGCWLRIFRHLIFINWHDVVKTVTVYTISVCRGDRKCHWIPPRTGSWRLVIRWKGSCHGDIWVL